VWDYLAVKAWSSANIRRVLWIGLLVVVAALASGALVLYEPGNFWTTVLQVVAIVAGAALGNAFALDHSRALLRQQARSSIRRLIEQATRMGRDVEVYESRAEVIRGTSTPPDRLRAADWFDDGARSLRHEIEATTSAIEDWGALAEDVQEQEIRNFTDRHLRMPRPNGNREIK
jgi:hypothetical protein